MATITPNTDPEGTAVPVKTVTADSATPATDPLPTLDSAMPTPTPTVGSPVASGGTKPKRHVGLWVLIILLVLAIAVAAYFFVQNQQAQSDKTDLQAQVTTLTAANTALKANSSQSATAAATNALKAYCDASVASGSTCTVTLTKLSGNFAIGTVKSSATATPVSVILKKSDNLWTPIFIGTATQTTPSAATITLYSIPTAITSPTTTSPSPTPTATVSPSPSPAK